MKDPLIIRIKLGDKQAFELLFRKYYVRLCGFANKFLDDPDLATDIVQEVFIKIWEGRVDLDSEDSVKSYIFKITQNLSLNKLRRSRIESKYLEILKLEYHENQEFSVHESLLAQELGNNITLAIAKLPAECRKVFELNRIEGFKYKEIAEKLDISVKTVEAQMSKALRILRTELRDYITVVTIALISGYLCF